MALTIESTFLATCYMHWVDDYLGPRYHVYRGCAHATVVKDSSLAERVQCATAVDLAKREALEWQADQDEDLDEAEVIHHLHQQAKSSPMFKNAISRTERSDAITTLVTSWSVESPSVLAIQQGRPLSSFHRLSFRTSMTTDGIGFCHVDVSNLNKIILNLPPRNCLCTPAAPSISGGNLPDFEERVVWQVQFDIVDLHSPRRLPTWRPGKRRRTTINQFYQVPVPPEQDASPRDHPPEAKRFKGVRYRRERRTWAAEMKPPKCKDKVSFGEFKSQAQAARAIDAAYHYYGKPHLLNFPDTPQILSTRPSPAGVLNEEDQLRFVKEQVKWLASVASALPTSPPLVAPEIPESSSRGCIGDNVGFCTLSEVATFLGCGVADESDDGTSLGLITLSPDALCELAVTTSMDFRFAGADAVGGIVGALEEHQGTFEWSLEAALVSPSSSGGWSPGSSVQITDRWDGAEVSGSPVPMHSTNSTEPSCETPDHG